MHSEIFDATYLTGYPSVYQYIIINDITAMKDIRKVLFLILLSTKIMAGDFYIAPQLAYVKPASPLLIAGPHEFEIFHLFRNTDNFIFLRTGAMISYEQKWFSFASGLLYSRAIIDKYSYNKMFRGLSILQLPLECKLHIGKKLYGYLSIGAYLNYLHPQKERYTRYFPDFQPGITAGIGTGYHFTSSLAIDISYRTEDSRYPFYYDLQHSSAGYWGRTYLEDENVSFRTLSLSLKYTLGRKNNEHLSRHSSPASIPRDIRKGKLNRSGKKECIHSNF